MVRIHIAVTLFTLVVGACANNVDDGARFGAAGKSDEGALASVDVKRYVVTHQQDTTTTEMADIGDAARPFAGVAWPGGAQGNVAEAGKPLAIQYERYESSYWVPPARCFDETSGTYYDCSESYGYTQYVQYKSVELQLRFDGGPIQTMTLAGDAYTSPNGTITIPADGEKQMTYWFKLTKNDGSVDWDSQHGANYSIHILGAPSSTLQFDSSWHTSQTADVGAGRTFRIDYDQQRLREEVRRALGVPDNIGPVDFYIGAHISFDGAQDIEVPVDFDGQAAFEPLVDVPAGTKSIALWFRGWGRFDKTAEVYDSNYGANYRFDVK